MTTAPPPRIRCRTYSIIAGTIKSHNDLGMFGGHRERPSANMPVRASCLPARANRLCYKSKSFP
jgi:hypothetical protein